MASGRSSIVGVPSDEIQGTTRGEAVRKWRDDCKLRRSSRYSIKEYTEEGAATLARAWCSKMQHLYNLSLLGKLGLGGLSPAEQQRSWEAPSELLVLRGALAVGAKAFARIVQIEDLAVRL